MSQLFILLKAHRRKHSTNQPRLRSYTLIRAWFVVSRILICFGKCHKQNLLMWFENTYLLMDRQTYICTYWDLLWYVIKNFMDKFLQSSCHLFWSKRRWVVFLFTHPFLCSYQKYIIGTVCGGQSFPCCDFMGGNKVSFCCYKLLLHCLDWEEMKIADELSW